jgi:glycosyltransferase involved in cell wall biosynthesis
MKTSAAHSTVQAVLPTRRLKVAVLNRVFSSAGGGAERYSIALVEQLAARHEMHVFAQEVNHAWPGVTYHAISGWFKKPRWLNQLWYAYATWRVTRQGFDVVHSHENVWHGHVQTIHVKTVKRSLLEGREGWKRGLRWLKIALSPRLVTYMALERVRMSPRPGVAIVAVSQALQNELCAQYPKAQAHVSVITPGVALPVQTMDQQLSRKRLSLPTEGQYVLFVANDYARKGLSTLLQAMQGMDSVRLLVVGHPGQIEHYQTVARTLGVQDRVHFLGSLQEMGPAYCAADVLAHPTLEDSFAMVVIEAMAHGLPVVVSGGAYCGVSSLLTHHVDALILEHPEDAHALRQALLQVLSNTTLASALRQAGETFANQHSWQHAAQAYEHIYNQRIRR